MRLIRVASKPAAYASGRSFTPTALSPPQSSRYNGRHVEVLVARFISQKLHMTVRVRVTVAANVLELTHCLASFRGQIPCRLPPRALPSSSPPSSRACVARAYSTIPSELLAFSTLTAALDLLRGSRLQADKPRLLAAPSLPVSTLQSSFHPFWKVASSQTCQRARLAARAAGRRRSASRPSTPRPLAAARAFCRFPLPLVRTPCSRPRQC